MFKTIGIFIKSDDELASTYLRELDDYLTAKKLKTILFSEPESDLEKLGISDPMDLAIVIGGDGTMLRVSRLLAPYGTPVIGINRGRLGFLTEITASNMLTDIQRVLDGDYFIQHRTMLSCLIKDADKIVDQATAFNDVVIGRGRIGRLIEFEIIVDGQLVNQTRGDGLIVTTPTGSTAYALASDGPIIHPGLDVIALVPISPHTLSHRPIVINGDSNIEISLVSPEDAEVIVSVDGYMEYTINNEEKIKISRSDTKVKLVHLTNYSYYDALRSKLGWSSPLT